LSEPPVHVNADGVHPEPRHTGDRLFDLVVGISAIAISVISLFVAIEHGHVERQLVAANSWPFVEAGSSNATPTGEWRVSFELINAGVGPAKLETFELFYDGRPMASEKNLIARCCSSGPPAPAGAWHGLSDNGIQVLRPGQIFEILSFSRTPENEVYWQRLNEARNHISFRGCYCSVLDECWVNDLQGLKPTPVKVCPKPALPYEGQDSRPGA